MVSVLLLTFKIECLLSKFIRPFFIVVHHKLINRCKDENTEEDGEQGIHRRIEHLKDIRNNTEWLLFDRQVGGGGHRGDVGDDGERPRQRRRGAEGPSGPGDWLGHAGLFFVMAIVFLS